MIHLLLFQLHFLGQQTFCRRSTQVASVHLSSDCRMENLVGCPTAVPSTGLLLPNCTSLVAHHCEKPVATIDGGNYRVSLKKKADSNIWPKWKIKIIVTMAPRTSRLQHLSQTYLDCFDFLVRVKSTQTISAGVSCAGALLSPAKVCQFNFINFCTDWGDFDLQFSIK